MALNPELVTFVKDGLARGVPRDRIEQALVRAGWPGDQVVRALAAFADVDFPIPVPRPTSLMSTRDAFGYVLMFSTLYISSFALGGVLFGLIDYRWPDPADPIYASPMQAIRWDLSALIVAFPLFAYMAWTVERTINADPVKRASRVRRQATYITLFLASCALIGDVIGLVYNFLGGELTLRFVLKVMTVAAIAGAVVFYYSWDLRQDEREPET